MVIRTAFLMGLMGSIVLGGELMGNGDFSQKNGKGPAKYEMTGDVEYRYLGDANREMTGMGVALISGRDLDRDGASRGAISQTVSIDPKAGRWLRFSFRGMPQSGFKVDGEELYVRVDYAGKAGQSYDHFTKPIYSQVEQARNDLQVNGQHKRNGAEAWRTYAYEIRVPFNEVGQAKFTVGFGKGRSESNDSAFYVTDFSLMPIAQPADVTEQMPKTSAAKEQAPEGNLIPLGGRWFYLAKPGETSAVKSFDSSNVDRLWYHDAVWSTPFVGNTSAVLKAGWKDLSGSIATKDQLIPRSVLISFEGNAMVIKSAGIPNHPTGRFPEMGRGNPSYITMQNSTFYIPLNPKESTNRKVIDEGNTNGALNMGPIGVAVNGVVFFNPFDMGDTDATDMMDRCCGHPQREGQYHYHKYPICVNSPWDDSGSGHSGLLGWAFDGYPLYGPYESDGKLAMEVTGANRLNEFNAHYDEARGWHYHVTPGKFPYLIGGYWGVVETKNIQRPPRGGGGNGGDRQGPPGGQMRGGQGRGGQGPEGQGPDGQGEERGMRGNGRRPGGPPPDGMRPDGPPPR